MKFVLYLCSVLWNKCSGVVKVAKADLKSADPKGRAGSSPAPSTKNCDNGVRSVSWAELGRTPCVVRVHKSQQTQGVINLELSGSKLTIGYDVQGILTLVTPS